MTTSNYSVIKRFMHRGNPIKSGAMSMSADGDTLYSYKTVIAKRVWGPGTSALIQVANRNWSITTTIHIGLLMSFGSFGNNNVRVRVPDVLASPDENLVTLRGELIRLAQRAKQRITNTTMWQFRAAKHSFDALYLVFWARPQASITGDFQSAVIKEDAQREKRAEMYKPNLERDLRRWIKSKVLYPKTRPGFCDYPEEIRLESVVPLLIRTSHGGQFNAEDIMNHRTAHFTDAQSEFINDAVQNYKPEDTK